MVMLPEDGGHALHAAEGHEQPMNNAENRVVNDGQWPNVEEYLVTTDVDPTPDKVDHWVRRPTGLRRPLQRYNSSLQYIMLANGVEALILKEARSYELKDCKGR